MFYNYFRNIYIQLYVCICLSVDIFIYLYTDYIYMSIQRERERERKKEGPLSAGYSLFIQQWLAVNRKSKNSVIAQSKGWMA